MAYSDGDVREALEAQGTDLVAKVPPMTNSGRFAKTEFHIDLSAGTVTCPAGLPPPTPGRPKTTRAGPPPCSISMPAPVKPAYCGTAAPREKAGAPIVVGRRHRRIEVARAAQAEPGTKALLRRRAKVERKIDHLQDLGMRQARYRGQRKARLQAFLAATVANLKCPAVLDVPRALAGRP